MAQPFPNACTDIWPAGPVVGTLVCLAGVNSGAYLFGGAQAEFRDWRIIAINTPGVDGMPLRLPLTPESYARQALEVLEGQGVTGPFVLLGHSLGGFAAQELAQMAPERVTRLILVSTCRGQPDVAQDVAKMPLKVGTDFWTFQRRVEKDAEATQRQLFGHGFAEREPLVFQRFLVQRQSHLPSQAASLAQMAAGGTFTSAPWVNQLTCPTLVVHGDDDVLISLKSGKKLAEALPQSRFLPLYGVGHFPMLEHPRFWTYVAAFAQGLRLGEDLPTPQGFLARLWERWTRSG